MKRELYGETGALDITLICVYSVLDSQRFYGEETFGMLYYADTKTFLAGIYFVCFSYMLLFRKEHYKMIKKKGAYIMKILIVEDDAHIAKMIEATLLMGNYESEICHCGEEAVHLILEGDYDLILLDVMLPEIDGFEIVQRVQKKGTPIIFLTALQDVADKVKGLRLGAEDYIVKPFEAIELLARIEVVLRRYHKSKTKYEYASIIVDSKQHTVYKNGQRISLTPKEFQVLLFFLQNIDIVITRDRLLSEVWGYEFEGETRTVDMHIQQIRRKLDLYDDLITIPKLGYRLESR